MTALNGSWCIVMPTRSSIALPCRRRRHLLAAAAKTIDGNSADRELPSGVTGRKGCPSHPVLAPFGHDTMSDLSASCASRRISADQSDGFAPYSTLTLAALIIGHHVAISAFCHLPSACGESWSFGGICRPMFSSCL